MCSGSSGSWKIVEQEEDIAPEAGGIMMHLWMLKPEDEGDEYDEDFDCLYIEPEEFFNLEDCLPLLSTSVR